MILHAHPRLWKIKVIAYYVFNVHFCSSDCAASRLRQLFSASSTALFVASSGRCFRHSISTALPWSFESVWPNSACSTIGRGSLISRYRCCKSFGDTTSVTSLISRSEILAINGLIIISFKYKKLNTYTHFIFKYANRSQIFGIKLPLLNWKDQPLTLWLPFIYIGFLRKTGIKNNTYGFKILRIEYNQLK